MYSRSSLIFIPRLFSLISCKMPLVHHYTFRGLGPNNLVTSSRSRICLAARQGGGGQGFGQPRKVEKQRIDADEDDSTLRSTKIKRIKSKGKQAARPPGQGYTPPRAPLKGQSPDDKLSLVDELEFEARLKNLQAESASIKRNTSKEQAKSGNILDRPSYENPPPLSTTLFGGDQSSDAQSREYQGLKLGPSQIGLAALSIALGVIFLITSSGSDLGSVVATRPKTSTGMEEMALGPETREQLKSQLKEASDRLSDDPNDLEALESAAVLHAKLGELGEAESKLERLTASKPDDLDAWRLLGEVRVQESKVSRAVDAYKGAWKAAKQQSLEVLTGLASSLIADGKPQEAVDTIRDSIASPESTKAMGEVELGMLLAKTYSQWPGHSGDASLQYDALAKSHPQDFRPPLGKALLLKSQGQEGEAQRYALQAKYLAPPSSRAVVDALLSGTR